MSPRFGFSSAIFQQSLDARLETTDLMASGCATSWHGLVFPVLSLSLSFLNDPQLIMNPTMISFIVSEPYSPLARSECLQEEPSRKRCPWKCFVESAPSRVLPRALDSRVSEPLRGRSPGVSIDPLTGLPWLPLSNGCWAAGGSWHFWDKMAVVCTLETVEISLFESHERRQRPVAYRLWKGLDG